MIYFSLSTWSVSLGYHLRISVKLRSFSLLNSEVQLQPGLQNVATSLLVNCRANQSRESCREPHPPIPCSLRNPDGKLKLQPTFRAQHVFTHFDLREIQEKITKFKKPSQKVRRTFQQNSGKSFYFMFTKFSCVFILKLYICMHFFVFLK